MGKGKKINNNRFENGKQVIEQAKKTGCLVRNAKGDHLVVETPPGHPVKGSMAFVNRDMGKGLGCKVYKWFKVMGLLGVVFIIGEQILSFV